MILLTGATGTIGSALLRRLTARGEQVRCLVRDPKRLGAERVRVQIALGNLADPASFRNALRGVDAVVHLAASIRDQPRGSIEELNAVATLRLVRAAERAGARRFVFASTMGASLQSPTRFFRAKALARGAVEASGLDATIVSPSIVYAPGDPWLTVLARMSHLPAMPISGSGRGLFQPIWAEDVADCLVALLDADGAARRGAGGNGDAPPHLGRDGSPDYRLAGPERLTYDDIVRTVLRALDRPRPLVHVPLPVVRRGLDVLEQLVGPSVFATWEEAELMEEPMTTSHGTADAESLGVTPRRMAAVLGAD